MDRVGKGRLPVVAKVEKPEAVDNLEAIVLAFDGVMVARGDLGVELAPEEVPVVQKQLVRAARLRGLPVIVATQMLESMIHSPTPTRAEASDVAGAVYEGADAMNTADRGDPYFDASVGEISTGESAGPGDSSSSSAPAPHEQARAHDVVGRLTPTAARSSPHNRLNSDDLPEPVAPARATIVWSGDSRTRSAEVECNTRFRSGNTP